MVFKEVTAVYCEKYGNINKFWVQKAQYSLCELCGIYSYRCALRELTQIYKKRADLKLTVIYNRVPTQRAFSPRWRYMFVGSRSVRHMSNHFAGQRSEKLSRLFMT
jgi:hypothetical protein